MSEMLRRNTLTFCRTLHASLLSYVQRLAMCGCVGTGDADIGEPGEWSWDDYSDCWEYWGGRRGTLFQADQIPGCTADDAIRAEVQR